MTPTNVTNIGGSFVVSYPWSESRFMVLAPAGVRTTWEATAVWKCGTDESEETAQGSTAIAAMLACGFPEHPRHDLTNAIAASQWAADWASR
jgi:hypothetical protein